jgi:hypothetical protein
MPAIREIKGDSEMPAMIEVDNGIAFGQSPRWMVYCSHNRGIPRKRGQDIVNGYVSGTGACSAFSALNTRRQAGPSRSISLYFTRQNLNI